MVVWETYIRLVRHSLYDKLCSQLSPQPLILLGLIGIYPQTRTPKKKHKLLPYQTFNKEPQNTEAMRTTTIITNLVALLAVGATAIPAPPAEAGSANTVEARAIPKECQKYSFWASGLLWKCVDEYEKTHK